MSFVENNKTWILPVLGFGAAAVVWFNIRTFSPSASPGLTPPPIVATAPPPQAVPEAPPTPGTGEALWDDLRPVAFVPADLEAPANLEKQALSGLGPEAFASPASPATPPPHHTVGMEPARSLQKAPVRAEGAPPPVPPADFLIEGPGGIQAWFDGQGYHAGQSLKGRPFKVEGIRIQPTPKVTLQGTSGSSPRSPGPAPVQEVP
jgi:hypothetical protein